MPDGEGHSFVLYSIRKRENNLDASYEDMQAVVPLKKRKEANESQNVSVFQVIIIPFCQLPYIQMH
jgi:hypothetical protein